jgi:hypothetical protein
MGGITRIALLLLIVDFIKRKRKWKKEEKKHNILGLVLGPL